MINIQLYNIITVIYLLVSVFYALNLFFKSKTLGKVSTGGACLGLGLHIIAFIVRWVESYQLGIGSIPIRGFYQGLTFLAGSSVLIYLIIEAKMKTRTFGIFVLSLAFSLMAYASLGPNVNRNIVPLPAVLRGNYITSHMLTWFLCYTFLFISFVLSLIILFKGIKRKNNSSSNDEVNTPTLIANLDNVSYIMVAVGFILLTIGIVTGMFRTNIIWGSYWTWDSTQTWSLITWLIYAFIIHSRLVWGWDGVKSAAFSIAGFSIAVYVFLVGAGFVSSSGHYPITS